MTNDYEMADDNRSDLIYGKDKLLAPLQPGMAAAAAPDGRRAAPTRTTTWATSSRSDRGSTVTSKSSRWPPIRRAHLDRRGRRVLGARRRRGAGRASAWSPRRRRCTRRSSSPTTMISLAVLYIAQDALFLGVVQVVVYTGAVMMLFLFVLMLIGVDSVGVAGGNHSRTTYCGDRRRRRLRHSADRRHRQRCPVAGFTGLAQANAGGNVRGPGGADLHPYLWAFELTSALLITAALGAMVLAHRERFERRKTQRELAEERFRPGGHPTPLPEPGRVRPAQRRRHAGPAARRLGRRALGQQHPGAPQRPRSPTRQTEAADEPGQLPLPVGVAVHDRRGRGAVAAQRDRHVHVRRADAERLPTWRS